MRGRVGVGAGLVLAVGSVALAACLRPSVVLAAGAHVVTVSLVAGQTPAEGGFNFNGYGHGGMTVTVPAGWTVVVGFRNAGALPHSAMIAPAAAVRAAAPPAVPVFAGAATPGVSTGLAQGAKATFSFRAGQPGTYAIMCGVPGHAAAGMWDRLVVSAAATVPSVTPAGAARLESR
jgi:sulfocyanin